MSPESVSFDDHLERWLAWKSSPWGRIRFAVVAETLARTLSSLGRGPFRVLDVGGGDGGDALPLAAAGHDVTIVDTSRSMLELARATAHEHGTTTRVSTVHASVDELATAVEGRYDLVLCHFLLQYRPRDVEDLARLVGRLVPGGVVSVIAPNPVGAVLGRLVRDGPGAALEELGSSTAHTPTFAAQVRKIPRQEMHADLEAVGARVVAEYGGRCANDLMTDDEAKHRAEVFDALLELELGLCDRSPYRDAGQFWQLVAHV